MPGFCACLPSFQLMQKASQTAWQWLPTFSGSMGLLYPSRTHQLSILSSGSSKDIQLTVFPSKSVKEGDTVIISCTCGSVPEIWIILKKKAKTGDMVLKSVNGSYTIRKAQLQDAGVYECESKTEVGSQLRSLTLDVKG